MRQNPTRCVLSFLQTTSNTQQDQPLRICVKSCASRFENVYLLRKKKTYLCIAHKHTTPLRKFLSVLRRSGGNQKMRTSIAELFHNKHACAHPGRRAPLRLLASSSSHFERRCDAEARAAILSGLAAPRRARAPPRFRGVKRETQEHRPTSRLFRFADHTPRTCYVFAL